MNLPLTLAFAAGILSFVSPCIVPMITVYLTLITGKTMEELTAGGGAPARRKLVLHTALFALGFTLVFTAAGGAAGAIGGLLEQFRRPLEIGGGVIVIALGFSMAGLFKLPWLQRLRLPFERPERRPAGPLGSLAVGVFFAVACSHCIAPTLYSMVVVAGTTGSPGRGMILMLAFSLGLAVPYLLTAVAIAPVLRRLSAWKGGVRWVQAGTGGLLAVFGVLMLAGQFARLVEISGRVLPFKIPLGM
ncbi:MAG: cytochrome c biogenesis protein CcdA [Actinobacteria bacterium]|nr:cytochrome c biogenesis protein CcdA [Actinomycetota bacterium]